MWVTCMFSTDPCTWTQTAVRACRPPPIAFSRMFCTYLHDLDRACVGLKIVVGEESGRGLTSKGCPLRRMGWGRRTTDQHKVHEKTR